MTRFIPLSFATALALAAMSMPVGAQQMVQSLASTDADLLAAQMRQLAANPRDVNALATAGELSLKLGDLSAAASLFARADKIDAGNGRVKAGMGAILVRSERPGEALRFYEQAERSGLPVARYAADRGLAYDLVGQQERAQRDYRTALAVSRDDETVRRYALSLGISGRQAQALEQLDPLIRRQDRAGWRAQAFVLAMNGDTAAATKIVTAMMPGNLAQGLAAFFQRLPSLSPVDRAFAVHFGEIQPTPERIADARLTPNLPPLAASPPVQVAAVAPSATAQPARRDARRARNAAPAQQVQTAPAQSSPVRSLPTQTQPVRVAAAPATAPVSTPSSPPVVWAAPRAVVQPLPPTPAIVARPAPVEVAAAPPVAPVQSSAATQRADSVLARIVANLSIPAAELDVAEPAAAPRAALPVRVAAAPASAAGRRVVAEASAKEARDTAVRRVVAARLTGNATADDAVTPTTRVAAAKAPVLVDARGRPLTAAQRRIAARKAAAEEAAAAAEVDKPLTPAQKRAAARKAAAGQTAVAAVEDDKPLTPAQKRAAARKAAAEEKALTPAEKRALARKEAADAKKEVAAKAAAAEKKAARANPARIWVQVASGANDAYLGQAWKTITAKAPQAFRGKAGYSQSVRATNRVMTGPFKTDAEARAFVNQLAKQGVPAYSVSTDAGEAVTRLPAK
jgi:tetratricopeptide (TPR) repeat protein